MSDEFTTVFSLGEPENKCGRSPLTVTRCDFHDNTRKVSVSGSALMSAAMLRALSEVLLEEAARLEDVS